MKELENGILIQKLNDMIKNDELKLIKFEYDKENNVMDIYVAPKKSLEFVTVNFTVTPTGLEFMDA